MKVFHPSRPRLPADQLSRQAARYRRLREQLEAAAAGPHTPENAAMLQAHRQANRDRYARRKARGDRNA
ncbi:MAG TPA: hypothetical protein VF595_00510 [Tepidisphaeraceae bacterium]